MIPVLFVIATLTFFMVRLAPGADLIDAQVLYPDGVAAVRLIAV